MAQNTTAYESHLRIDDQTLYSHKLIRKYYEKYINIKKITNTPYNNPIFQSILMIND